MSFLVCLYHLHPCPIYTVHIHEWVQSLHLCHQNYMYMYMYMCIQNNGKSSTHVVDPLMIQWFFAEYNFSNNAFMIQICTMLCSWSNWFTLWLIEIVFLFLVSSHSLRYIPFGSIFGVFTYSIYGVYVACGYKTFPKHAAKYIWG